MLELDGSYGAGGGSLLRTSLALSAVLGIPFRMRNIRARRPRPGLMPQHLAGVRAAAQLTDARVEGARLYATELVFTPHRLKRTDLVCDVADERGSAGAVTLVAQTILPIMVSTPGEVRAVLRGGTHVPFSPVFEYLREVLLPFIRRLGFYAEAELVRAGFYPAGGGEVVLRTRAASGKAAPEPELVLDTPGALRGVRVVAAVAGLPASIAQRMATRAAERVNRELPGIPVETELFEFRTKSPGCYLFLRADYTEITVGFSGLGKKGRPAEAIADQVVAELLAHHRTGTALDPYLADQVLVFLALARKGFHYTTSRLTDHLRTNIWTVTRFLPLCSIEVTGLPEGTQSRLDGRAGAAVRGYFRG